MKKRNEVSAKMISDKVQLVISRGRGWAFAHRWLVENRDAVRDHFRYLSATEESKIQELGLLTNSLTDTAGKTVDRF